MPDLHVGLLSWHKETNEDYDLKIVKEIFNTAINDIWHRCSNKQFKEIVFVTLGDFLHIDNNENTTTKGTIQQADGRLGKIVEVAEDMLIETLRILGTLAPVRFIYTSGNNARVTEYMLVRALKNVFLNDNNITFDIEPNQKKVHYIGNNVAIGYVHGDMPKQNITDFLNVELRKSTKSIKFAEVHAGHYHSEHTKTMNGVIVKYMPTLSAASYWENQQGYESQRSMVCNVWSKENGLRESWQFNI